VGQRTELLVLNAQGWVKELISQCRTVKGGARSGALYANLSVMHHKAVKAENGGRQTGLPSKSRQGWIPELISGTKGSIHN
jgi:hypothetical protein